MSLEKVDLLRIVFAPSHAVKSVPVPCTWRQPDGAWQSGQFEHFGEIAARFRIKRLEVSPHPADVSMIEADLPPLPVKKRRSAVYGVVELLALGSPLNLMIGFGPRDEDGKVPIAWIANAQVAKHLAELAHHGLRVDAVLPPPAFLPISDSAAADGSVSAALIDDCLLVRSGAQSGGLYPIPAGARGVSQLEARLQVLFPGKTQVQWHGAAKTMGMGDDEPLMWSGVGWGWELPLADSAVHRREANWQRPAMAWGVGVVLVWLVGLNLYAQHVQEQGQALKQAMAAQVKSAFPQLSVVLNPLQQARQLRDARNAGDGVVTSDDFGTLLRSATSLLSQATGQVERLAYQGGQLQIGWREGVMLKASELEALQMRASERGFAIDANEGGLRLRIPALEKAGSALTDSAESP